MPKELYIPCYHFPIGDELDQGCLSFYVRKVALDNQEIAQAKHVRFPDGSTPETGKQITCGTCKVRPKGRIVYKRQEAIMLDI